MNKLMLLLAASVAALPLAAAPARQQAPANATESPFTYQEVMVPMRDGAKLQTVIIRPRGKAGKLPILLQRTPYGVPAQPPASVPASMRFLMEDGYVLVFQNMLERLLARAIGLADLRDRQNGLHSGWPPERNGAVT